MNFSAKASLPFVLLSALVLGVQGVSFGQAGEPKTETLNKMKIEIWSDVACPFCYIGHAHLMTALEQFPQKDEVEIVWKSFILDPTLPQHTEQDLFTSLSERKGMPMPQVMQMTAYVEDMAQKTGLQLNFKAVKPVSTFDAHKVLQLAKQRGLGNEAKLSLFKAYFTEGANIADKATLVKLGKDIGLSENDITAALSQPAYAEAVQKDVSESRRLGVRGVPYFVMNGSVAVSGAQAPAGMLQAIEQAYEAWSAAQPASAKVQGPDGVSCVPEVGCE